VGDKSNNIIQHLIKLVTCFLNLCHYSCILAWKCQVINDGLL